MPDTESAMKQIHQRVLLFYMELCHERSPMRCVTRCDSKHQYFSSKW